MRLAVNQKEWQWGQHNVVGASPSRRGYEMHTAVVQKPAVWPSFGANFMTDSTIIAVFLCFCFGYFYVICIIAAHSRYERITGGDDAMYNVDNSFRKDVVTVVLKSSDAIQIKSQICYMLFFREFCSRLSCCCARRWGGLLRAPMWP